MASQPAGNPSELPSPDVGLNRLEEAMPPAEAEASESLPEGNASPEESSTYGPVRTRRRVGEKMGEPALYRPPATKESDFVDLMRDLVPALLDEATGGSSSSSSSDRKRDRDSPEPDPSEPPAAKARVEDEIMLVDELSDAWEEGVEAFVAAYIQKKMSKELAPVGNEPILQKQIDEPKVVEWSTPTLEKQALRIHYGKRAAELKQKHPDRFIGSRFVIIRKPAEEGRKIDPEDSSS